jgi:hypothetical protein
LAYHLLESRLSEFGRQSRFAADEQRTHMSLWVIFRSPLTIGRDLPTMDAAPLAYFTNEEAMAIDQHSRSNRAQAHGPGLYKVSPAK